MSIGLCPTSQVVTFDQNWNHPYCCTAGRRYFNHTQIRVIGSMEIEICKKMLRNLSEKLGANFSVTTLSYCILKIAYLDDAFVKNFFNWK